MLKKTVLPAFFAGLMLAGCAGPVSTRVAVAGGPDYYDGYYDGYYGPFADGYWGTNGAVWFGDHDHGFRQTMATLFRPYRPHGLCPCAWQRDASRSLKTSGKGAL